MNKMLSEILKVDVALNPQVLAAAPVDTDFYRLNKYRKALFVVEAGQMLVTETIVIAAWESDGVAPQVLNIGTAAAPVGVGDTITANTNAAEVTITAAAAAVGDTVTVNGLVFEGVAVGDVDLPNRLFLADPASDPNTADSLEAAINHATAGVPGVFADSDGASVVTLTAATCGEIAITVVSSDVTNFVPITIRAVAYIEVDDSYLSTGFDRVGIRITPDVATIPGGVVLVRGAGRYTPQQFVAASDNTRIV